MTGREPAERDTVKNIIVAGAGPSGLIAAIFAARAGARVLVLEGMKKPGRKLLMTGNGRCNLTNLDPDLPEKYLSAAVTPDRTDPGQNAFWKQVLNRFGVSDTLSFFEEIGLYTTQRDDCVYPRSNQAGAVLSALLFACERWKVRLKYDAKVTSVRYDTETSQYFVGVSGWEYQADAVILCCGSRAVKETGSDGSGYQLARSLNHTVTPVMPALTALHCADPLVRNCAGARTYACVSLYREEERPCLLGTETGEVQWTASELSGIPVFGLTRFLPFSGVDTEDYEKLFRTRRFFIKVDLLPERDLDQVTKILREQFAVSEGRRSPGQVLSGLIHEKVAGYVVQKLQSEKRTLTGGAQEDAAERIARELKNLCIPIDGLRGFDQAQVCRGGVLLDEVDPVTLGSKRSPGLFFAGEILDVDGPCGGYNLQWAWSSGAVAGISAAKDGRYM